MNVQELLEHELAKAANEVRRLEKEEEIAIHILNKAHRNLADAELQFSELEEALSVWVDQ